MLTTVLVTLASTSCLLLAVFGVWALFVSQNRHTPEAPDREPTGYLQELAAKLAALEVIVHGLPSLWEEERDRTLKFANRAYASEKRTRELLAEDEEYEGNEEEDQRILELDAIRSEVEPMQALSDGMGSPIDADLQARAAAVMARGF